ncbi:RING-type domain-containing protein [Aphelenchoides fujianensis]|nr:RING-type domain-containing protein [Aphelenchoides fujianensis]
MFCFGCIERWMLQRQTCPLCKKAVRQLKHRLKHIRKTEPSWNSEGKIETARSLIEAEDYRQLREREWPFNEEYVLITGAIGNLQMLLQDRKNWRAKEVFNTRLFRFVVYYMNADRSALIPSNSSVVLNEEYVRTNRKNLRVQWIPFVAREIRSITGLNTIDIDSLLDLIFDAMQFGGDRKLKLFDRLRALGVDHPRTFFSSVHSFGSANQSMELYDACSRYETRRGLSRVFTDDDNDDVHVVFANGDRDVEVLGTSRPARPLPVLHVPHSPPSAPPPVSGRIPFISNRNLFSMPTLPHLFEYGPMSSHHPSFAPRWPPRRRPPS